jgi:dTDP-4-dehydrorhamnose 3,5-epimerase
MNPLVFSPETVLVVPRRFADNRGFFSEIYSHEKYKNLGINAKFVQDNHSLSYSIGTLRGLHFQAPPSAQGKLVRCGRGAIFDVAVDIRRGSPTFGHWEGHELTDENGHQFFIPVGFAHGFVTLRPDSEIVYKCTDYYAPETDGAVCWNSCGIDWPVIDNPILSDRDRIAPALGDFESPFIYGVNS